ncbi:hypothetical protein GCM10009682_61430 [Luedemannella flava]|uniref:Uncharacterized protein n=1 Tax=Luedemannella flava TaxID=349316 RepID=A0ABP4Z1V6_9ACTN
MSCVERWLDTDHLRRAADTAGGQDAFDASIGGMLGVEHQQPKIHVGRCGYPVRGKVCREPGQHTDQQADPFASST